uniref:receptor protein-tyrosine kinase n=1 Tax=Panagrellus redivivus TaxID=6233 RepID=A0A7E4VYI8_PANRE
MVEDALDRKTGNSHGFRALPLELNVVFYGQYPLPRASTSKAKPDTHKSALAKSRKLGPETPHQHDHGQSVTTTEAPVFDEDDNSSEIFDDSVFDDEDEESGGSKEVEIAETDSEMAPKPYDDLFIEPAGDYDVVYGDYNATMDDSTGKRPYIRLTSVLPNVTRHLGGEIRLKCEAAGAPLPITFTWLKNNAPIEKNRRTKVRSKEYFSKLIISDLDAFDSAYYQCTASNVAGSVNSTSVLRVESTRHKPSEKPSKKPANNNNDDYSGDDIYNDYSDEMSPHSTGTDRGRLPAEEDLDLYRVPANAAGAGYVPLGAAVGGHDRWLDGVTLRVGDCVLYQGEACRAFLSGKHVMVTAENREAFYDVDRELRAAMMFISHIPDLSTECKKYSHAVACYHMYKVCDQTGPSTSSASKKIISLCRKDCDSLKDEVCPRGFSMAAQHELVGDSPKALLPHCTSLSENAGRCLRVLEPVQPPPAIQPNAGDQWCFNNVGNDYTGPVSQAVNGRRCLPWSQSTDANYNTYNYPVLNGARNYCRNPSGDMSGPWCYTAPHAERELCDIPRCPIGGNPSPGLIDNVSEAWGNLSSQWQLAAFAGLGGIAVLLLFLLLCCCCRKKSSSSSSSSVKKSQHTTSGTTGFGIQSCNGSSIVNSGYGAGRKYPPSNGSHLPAYEMNALLPPHPPPSAGGYPTNYMQQYSPPTTEPPVEPYHVREIPAQSLKLDKVLGEGSFTALYGGEMGTERGLVMPIVVKMLKTGFSKMERDVFEDEIRTAANMEHHNVVRLLGVAYVDGQQISAVFDYNCHGNLRDFLKVRKPLGYDGDEKEQMRNFEDFFRIATQIASGMEFLSRCGHVHRDLATRNCLVGDQQVIKIADFASLVSDYDDDYYNMSSRTRVPLRWLSKEALTESRFTSASDVYAFGVTLWEIYTYGRQPYDDFTNADVVKKISMHDVLYSPPGCPPNVYSVMIECWNEAPERRPSFAELHARFQKWCIAGPCQLFMNTARTNSTHSGGSSSKHRSSSHSASNGPGNAYMIADPFQVPPPAPPMHSTPIGRL